MINPLFIKQSCYIEKRHTQAWVNSKKTVFSHNHAAVDMSCWNLSKFWNRFLVCVNILRLTYKLVGFLKVVLVTFITLFKKSVSQVCELAKSGKKTSHRSLTVHDSRPNSPKKIKLNRVQLYCHPCQLLLHILSPPLHV
jgi:hypothetical protein